MADLGGRTILVTGATDGLGRALATHLHERGATVLVHGRDRRRVAEAVTDLASAGGDERVRPYLADFASLREVGELARAVEEAGEGLDVLVNNAGVGGIDRAESEDGYELHFAVNHLAPFALTRSLSSLLQRSRHGRVVNVSSAAQHPIDFDDPLLERSYEPMLAYAQSKLAQVLFTVELAERLGTGPPTVNALHPATLMDTKMVRESFGRPHSSVAEGVEATARLAVAEELDGVTGRYFDGVRESRPHRQARDPEARRRLWELSARLVEAAAPP